ncbi:MAG: hypothetical protein ABIG95_03390, partial [Candidatus Woesearchaeota archaeon]
MGAKKSFKAIFLIGAWISVLMVLSMCSIATSYLATGKSQYQLASPYPCIGKYDSARDITDRQLTAGKTMSCFPESSEKVKCYDSNKYLFDATVISCQNVHAGSTWVVEQAGYE